MTGFSTTIKQKYWDRKKADIDSQGFFFEYKDTSDYWNKRLSGLKLPVKGNFLVGKKPHKVTVRAVVQVRRKNIPEQYRDALETEIVWRLHCVPVDKPEKDSTPPEE